jgi:hypothetical protein
LSVSCRYDTDAVWGRGTGLTESSLVTKRNVDEAVVRQGRHASDSSALLSATQGTGGNEHSSVLAPEASLSPLLASLVPEGLELRWEVSVTGGDTEQDAVKGFELGGVLEDGHIGLGRRIHLVEDILGERLGNLEHGGVATGVADTLELCIGLEKGVSD